jgi:hypothetical protein
MPLIIDLLPEERRSPGVVDRALLIEEVRPQLEELVRKSIKEDGAKLAEIALILAEKPGEEWEAHIMTRKTCKAFLDKHLPNPHPGGYRGFDAPEGVIVIAAIGAKGGVTIAGITMPFMEVPTQG